jgi:hypothetical protein
MYLRDADAIKIANGANHVEGLGLTLRRKRFGVVAV